MIHSLHWSKNKWLLIEVNNNVTQAASYLNTGCGNSSSVHPLDDTVHTPPDSSLFSLPAPARYLVMMVATGMTLLALPHCKVSRFVFLCELLHIFTSLFLKWFNNWSLLMSQLIDGDSRSDTLQIYIFINSSDEFFHFSHSTANKNVSNTQSDVRSCSYHLSESLFDKFTEIFSSFCHKNI